MVGVDDSQSSEAVLRWAVKAATRRQAGLRIVHVCELVRTEIHAASEVEARLKTFLRVEGQRLLADGVAMVRASQSDLNVSSLLREGSAWRELVAESVTADMLVVGNLGIGGFAGLLLGSTARKLITDARCAVVAVPIPSRDEAVACGVTVGVEGGQIRPAILEFAFREASSLREPLTAVHAWLPPKVLGPGRTMPEVFDEEWAETIESAELTVAINEAATRYPNVEVHQKSLAGHPAKVLIEEARGSRLLVVGTRGRGELQSFALGSVSHAVLHHAHQVVAVVPSLQDD